MDLKCKCHGLSGSCEQKTCWRSVPYLRVVSRALKEKYRYAIMVDQSNLVNRGLKKRSNNKPFKKRKPRNRLAQWIPPKNKTKKSLKRELLFYEKSPNFCESAPSLDYWGTTGRVCNRSTFEQESCSTMCCGRGYNQIMQRTTQACNCTFHWCCEVQCKTCVVEEWISICK